MQAYNPWLHSSYFWSCCTLSCIYSLNKLERNYQVKIEKFLEYYIATKPIRYSYADIKEITNQFQDKLGEGGCGTVYKGKLFKEVHVAVKILNNSKGNGERSLSMK